MVVTFLRFTKWRLAGLHRVSRRVGQGPGHTVLHALPSAQYSCIDNNKVQRDTKHRLEEGSAVTKWQMRQDMVRGRDITTCSALVTSGAFIN